MRLAIGDLELEALGDFRHQQPQQTNGASHRERTAEEMIRSIQRLDQTLVREVMRPLNKVLAVNLTATSPMELLKLAKRTGNTRFPAYFSQVTNLVGYLNIYDFLKKPLLPKNLKSQIHEAKFIPESARVDVVLRDLLKSKAPLAICFDEFGGCSGIITTEDILEEIIGDVMDEHDRPSTMIEEKENGSFSVDPHIDLDDLRDLLGLSLEKSNCDTLSGYIYHLLSRVPRRREKLEAQGWKIEVTKMDAHRIHRVRLTPPIPRSTDSASQIDVQPPSVT